MSHSNWWHPAFWYTAITEPRLSLTSHGNVPYQLKTPYRDGTTHVILDPLYFMARLAALVQRPRVNLTSYHGMFALNSPHRGLVTKAGRERVLPALGSFRNL